MRLLLAAFCAVFFVSAAQAQTLQTMLSTPDISVTATASTEVQFRETFADYVAIKNDCADDLYFDLRDSRDAAANHAPIRLAQDNSFSVYAKVYSIFASPAAGNATTCTFTLFIGKF